VKRRAFLWGSNGNARYTPLEHAKADALALASTLSSERYRFEARVHADTSDPYDVHRALRSAALACAPDDLFVGYFSGHGQVIGGKLYLVIDNSDPDTVSTLFASTWLIDAFRECPARNRLLVLDCCHAGAATGVKGAGLPFEELMPELRNELILYASGKLEDARELPELGGGFLTRSLCRELDAIPAPASLRAIARRLERAAVQHNTTVGASKRVPIPFLSGLQQGELYFEDFAADVAREPPFVTVPVPERDVAIDEAVRRIAAKADDAARLLVRGITNARRDWQYSLRCGSAFSSAHATNRDRDAISDLAELLKSADKEVCRCAVYAFGFLGVGGWCWEVRKAAPRTELHSFVVQALMRMFVASTDETTLKICSQQLREYFSEIEDDFSVPERLIMGGVTGAHVDELIRRWLTSENKKIRRTAIKVLGVARFTRAVQHLVPLLGEPALSGDVARSLAAIGTPEAVAAVQEHGGDDSPLAEQYRREMERGSSDRLSPPRDVSRSAARRARR